VTQRFDEDDKEGLEEVVRILETSCSKSSNCCMGIWACHFQSKSF